jgi:hypothetical protein
VEYESKSDNGNNTGSWNHLKITQTIPEQHNRKARSKGTTKRAISGTAVVSRPCPSRERIVDVVLGGNGFELWLRPGFELLALTITCCTRVYRVYCAQVTKLQRGRELRLSVICPRGDLVVLIVWRLVKKCRTLCYNACRGH